MFFGNVGRHHRILGKYTRISLSIDAAGRDYSIVGADECNHLYRGRASTPADDRHCERSADVPSAMIEGKNNADGTSALLSYSADLLASVVFP